MSYLVLLQQPQYWQRLVQTCLGKIERGSRSGEVRQLIMEMSLVETYRDVEAVLLDSRVDVYWGRFVAFITWLHRHALAYPYWRHLVQDHPELVTKALCELTVV